MDSGKRTAFEIKVKRYVESRTATRETARRTLIDQGIYTQDGKVAAEYGGEKESSDASSTRR